MKKLSLISLFFLSSCFYSNGCIYTPQMVNCFDKSESFTPIAHYQKEHSIGLTNVEQRWKDVVNCGGKYGDESLRSAMTKDKNSPIDETMQRKFRQCMRNKGYIRIQNCGLKNSPSDTKQCN